MFITHFNSRKQLLQKYGIMNLQNFWYILKPTWIKHIKTHPNLQNKPDYITHIATGNNNNLHDISISHPIQRTIFFNTISLVFNISIKFLHILNNSHHETTLNACHQHNPIKILNIRTSIYNTDLYEPWINPIALTSTTQVITFKLLLFVINFSIF